jgi:hypothetical protein
VASLLELAPEAAFVVALAIVLLVKALVDGLFKPLFSLPVVGGTIESLLSPLYQSITNALGTAAGGLEALIGASWHQLARQMDWLWREIRAHAVLILSIATPLGLILNAVHGIKALVHRLTVTNTHSGARLKALDRRLERLQHRERVLEHDLAKGIGEDVLPRIKSLDREINKIRTKDIPAIRAADAQASDAISNLYEWAKGKAALVGVGTFAFAVAAVLDTLGLGGIKCPSFGNLFNKRGCGLWNELEDVLGLLVDALVLVDLCNVIPTIEGLLGEFEGPLVTLVSDAANAVCAQPPSGWTMLSSPPLSLPSAGEITATL